MTQPNPFTPVGQGGGTPGAGYLDIRIRQGNPMIVKVWDNPEYVRTANNKDGMVYPKDNGEPFPNRAVRAAIVDLNATAPDGTPGILYPESWIQASSLMKEAKKWIGAVKLVRWKQTGPLDGFGVPDKSAPYEITDLMGDQAVVAQAMAWMQAHPEFDALQPPAPYDGKPPTPKAPQQQQPFYGQQQPGYYGQQPPQQPWQPPVPPQQPPQQWNTAAPPPEYYTQQPQWAQQQQQQGPPQPGYNAPQIAQYMQQQDQWAQQGPPQGPYGGPPAQQGPPQQQWQQQPPQQAPQGAPGSFFDASQGQQGPQTPQWQGGFNQQTDSPPF